MKPGLRTQWDGRKKVLLTHPLSKTVPCVDRPGKIEVPMEKQCSSWKSPITQGNWRLVVLVNGKEALSEDITETKWHKFQIDLSKHAGKTINIELLNQATGWSHEAKPTGAVLLVH